MKRHALLIPHKLATQCLGSGSNSSCSSHCAMTITQARFNLACKRLLAVGAPVDSRRGFAVVGGLKHSACMKLTSVVAQSFRNTKHLRI